MLEPLDLGFLGLPRVIGVYLLETPDGPALYDCGPTTTLPALREGLRKHGLELTDIRHLMLSHIHLDHAGAAGVIVREHPELQVWVSAIGAPHLIEPSRLERSARRLYGDRFDELWDELAPVPEENIKIATGEVLGWEVFDAPGHASHHVCYFKDGLLLGGDVTGVRSVPSEYMFPVAPPPDIDVDAWHHTIGEIKAREPKEIALIHFGVVTEVGRHLARLESELDRWSELVRSGVDSAEFAAQARKEAGAEAELYELVVPYDQSWQGFRRYWDKRDGK